MTTMPFNLQRLPLTGQDFPWSSFGQLEYSSIASLSRLDGMVKASAKADLFWLTWLMKEAQYSNEIEGTITTFDEIMGGNAGLAIPAERKDDVQEVLNYRSAMIEGIEQIKDGRQFSLSFVKSLHCMLLHGARGENKTPGTWRKQQVHIGKPGEPLEKASYIPPDPLHVEELLENWETFSRREDINPIIQTAVLHAQFELIHPFLDGNGRMGRLLITLFLTTRKVLQTPCSYMSAYLQSHRENYYTALEKISREGDWNTWIGFFLTAVVEHSEANGDLLLKMTTLYETSKTEFAKATGSSLSIGILDYVFAQPIFTIPNLVKDSSQKISKQSAVQLVHRLEEAKLVSKISEGSGSRPALWKFGGLVELLP